MSDFTEWLDNELVQRGWSYSETSRRAGLSRSVVSMVANGKTSVTWEFCNALAQAFDMPPTEVFRKAGLLVDSDNQEVIEAVTEVMKEMKTKDQKEVLNYAKYRYQNPVD